MISLRPHEREQIGGWKKLSNMEDDHWISLVEESWDTIVWVNYNDLTATSLEIMVNKGNHPQMALIQVSEIL